MKEPTLKEAATNHAYEPMWGGTVRFNDERRDSFIAGAKWALKKALKAIDDSHADPTGRVWEFVNKLIEHK